MTDCALPDLSGRLDVDEAGRFHRLAIRVYFEDTDFSGVVYHASYLRWCERGRSDFLRLLGNNHEALFSGNNTCEPAAFVVRRMSLEFLKPARIDDIVIVETRLDGMGAATLQLKQTVKKQNQPIFETDVLVVLMGLSGKPQRLSQRLRKTFLDWVT